MTAQAATAASTEVDAICDFIRQWLDGADIDMVRRVRYQAMGMADSGLRDLVWTWGRKAGRVHAGAV